MKYRWKLFSMILACMIACRLVMVLSKENGWGTGTTIAIYMGCGVVVGVLHAFFFPEDKGNGK